MSGVFGYISRFGKPLVSEIAEQMGERMCHLPYTIAQSAAVAPTAALGHVGIGIFNRALQPISSSDGQIRLCLVGEFYHQQALRAELAAAGRLAPDADDAQLALAVYLRDGAAGLTRLDGAFVAAVWDGRAGELLLVNDRYGLYPHYYAALPDGLAFAPEIKALLVAPQFNRRLDHAALAQFVRFQQLLGDRTWFEDVKLLPPASVLRFHAADARLSLDRYWEWHHVPDQHAIAFPEAVAEASRLFQRSVDARVAPPHRAGVFLSGGLDARIILGFVRQPRGMTTLTFGVPGCRDVIYSAELARRSGTSHHWFPLNGAQWVLQYVDLHLALTEGAHSWMHLHGISTLADARALMDVNLSGWDGEVVLGGLGFPDHYHEDPYYRYAARDGVLMERLYDSMCRTVTWPGLTDDEARPLFGGRYADLNTRAYESLAAEVARTERYPAERRAEFFYLEHVNRRQYQNQLVVARSAIEVRCPYFDYDFVDFMLSLPPSIRVTPAFRRAVLTGRAPHLATVPYERDDRLPHSSALMRNTHASIQWVKRQVNRRIAPIFPERPRLYADYEQYLRSDLRSWAEGILFDQRTLDRGLFEPSAVRSLWERHVSGKELWTIGKIAPLMTLELVLRMLYDERVPAVGETA